MQEDGAPSPSSLYSGGEADNGDGDTPVRGLIQVLMNEGAERGGERPYYRAILMMFNFSQVP